MTSPNPIRTFRDPDVSLWQSAVDAVVCKGKARTQDDLLMRAVVAWAEARGKAARLDAGSSWADDAECRMTGAFFAQAMQLAQAFAAGTLSLGQLGRQLTAQFGTFDPRWIECATTYAEYFVLQQQAVPYRRHKSLDDFVVDGVLPDSGKVALIGDWGTGTEEALATLREMAWHRPDVAIHLGDIYYSGTGDETLDFYENWRSVFLDVPSLTLAGNHDMYSGGLAYYDLIEWFDQPASYFSIRNAHWQFIGIDTGLNSIAVPERETYLENSEVEWLANRVSPEQADGRRNVLLSHHQLFSAYEMMPDGGRVNSRLYGQVRPLLPDLACWFWGHEHDLVTYFSGLYGLKMARCLGHGAIPVDWGPRLPADGVLPVQLGNDGTFYRHGYAIVELDGPAATVAYYQSGEPNVPLYQETL